jgi:hypothetical protein
MLLTKHIALTVNSTMKFPLNIKPKEQANGDFKFMLRKYYTEETLCNLEYQY